MPEPETQEGIPHPDWVSCVDNFGNGRYVDSQLDWLPAHAHLHFSGMPSWSVFATGCYDGVVRVFNGSQSQEPIAQVGGATMSCLGEHWSDLRNNQAALHLDAVKCISTFGTKSSEAKEEDLQLVSGSGDHSLRVWQVFTILWRLYGNTLSRSFDWPGIVTKWDSEVLTSSRGTRVICWKCCYVSWLAESEDWWVKGGML